MHKGYAFVQFTNPFDARNACHGEDGRTILSQVLGKKIIIRVKRSRQIFMLWSHHRISTAAYIQSTDSEMASHETNEWDVKWNRKQRAKCECKRRNYVQSNRDAWVTRTREKCAIELRSKSLCCGMLVHPPPPHVDARRISRRCHASVPITIVSFSSFPAAALHITIAKDYR